MFDVELLEADGQVAVRVVSERGFRHACPDCGEKCPRHDTRRHRWCHLDTRQYKTILEAQIPCVLCKEHDVRQVRVPWGEPGSRFTALFETIVIDWLKEASVSTVCRQPRLSWDEASGIMERAVARALRQRPALSLTRIGVD